MKLEHAIKVASHLQGTAMNRGLSPEEGAALAVLLEMARRVSKAKPAVRDLARALHGAELNQVDLFGEEPRDG